MRPTAQAVAVCLMALLAWTTSACAEASADRPAGAATMDTIAPPLRKLGRGLANAGTGFLEVPYKIWAVNEEQGPVAAISVGVLAGMGAAVTRTVAGAVEAATFLFPLGRYGYGPLVKPEFLLRPDES